MKTLLPIFLLFIALGLFSCKEDSNEATITAAITAIQHVSGHGEITFTWQQPADKNFFYTDIRYSIDGVEYSKKVNKYRDSTTIDGWTSVASIDFQFYAVNDDGDYSPMTPYQAAPLVAPFVDVASSVVVTSNFDDGEEHFNEALVSWVNMTGKQVTIEVAYINNAGEPTSTTFTTTETGSGVLRNLAGGPGKIFTVVVRDAKLNSSDAQNFTVNVSSIIQMDKSKWSFPGYAASNTATIGYSSQALNEATTTYPLNGSVRAMIDGNVSTFWHASWSNPVTDYPHWFIIDFGVEVSLTNIEMTKRQGNVRMQTGFQVLTCTEAGAVDLDHPTTWDWQDQGEFTFDPNSDTVQKYQIAAKPRARYIQVYMADKFRGSDKYAMIAEFNAFALDE
jgi:hypothetical protein